MLFFIDVWKIAFLFSVQKSSYPEIHRYENSPQAGFLRTWGAYLKELEEGNEERRLTVRKCARIQTFPDDIRLFWC